MKESLHHLRCQRQRIVRLHHKRLLAAILTIALAGVGFHLFAAWPTGKPVPSARTPQVNALREERLATLRRILELVDKRYHAGGASMVELVTAKRDVAEAELDSCTTQKERVRVLEKMVDDAAVLESQAAQLARNNVASEEAALAIKADLLRLRIRLQEAQVELSRELHGCEEKAPLSGQLE